MNIPTKLNMAAVLVSACFVISACANFTHFNESQSGFDGRQKTTFIDAKQRVIVSNKLSDDQIRTCAEPSPDALSAIAASQDLSFGNGSIDLGLGNALAESAGSIGLRTQSIQLMRDAMYRLCEMYMSGAISDLSFETMNRRFQSSMVAILAIEQLTGAVRPPALGLEGRASTGPDPASAVKFADAETSARAELKAAEKALADHLSGEYAEASQNLAKQKAEINAKEIKDSEIEDQLKPHVERMKAADAKKNELEADVQTWTDAHKIAQRNIRAALRPTSRASSDADFEQRDEDECCDVQARTEVAEAVRGIVSDTLSLTFSRELCTTILINAMVEEPIAAGDDAPPAQILSHCLDQMEETANMLSAQTSVTRARANAIDAITNELIKDPENEDVANLFEMLSGEAPANFFLETTPVHGYASADPPLHGGANYEDAYGVEDGPIRRTAEGPLKSRDGELPES